MLEEEGEEECVTLIGTDTNEKVSLTMTHLHTTTTTLSFWGGIILYGVRKRPTTKSRTAITMRMAGTPKARLSWIRLRLLCSIDIFGRFEYILNAFHRVWSLHCFTRTTLATCRVLFVAYAIQIIQMIISWTISRLGQSFKARGTV